MSVRAVPVPAAPGPGGCGGGCRRQCLVLRRSSGSVAREGGWRSSEGAQRSGRSTVERGGGGRTGLWRTAPGGDTWRGQREGPGRGRRERGAVPGLRSRTPGPGAPSAPFDASVAQLLERCCRLLCPSLLWRARRGQPAFKPKILLRSVCAPVSPFSSLEILLGRHRVVVVCAGGSAWSEKEKRDFLI